VEKVAACPPVISAEASTSASLKLTTYIRDKVIRRPGIEIDENTPLVSSGLIDSFALLDIFLQLESVTGRKIPIGKVRAKDMDTVGLMLAMAEKLGHLTDHTASKS
jgi:acyl carrier protein